MKIRYSICLCVLLLMSCIKDESDLIPQPQPGPVINALLSPELPFIAYATFSKGILDTSQMLPYASAKLGIYENGQLLDSMVFIDSLGLYVSAQLKFPQPGHCYSVQGQYGASPMLVSTVSCVPAQVQIQQLLLDTAFSVEDNRNTYRLGVVFTDAVETGSLYQLSLLRYRLNKEGSWELGARCVRSSWEPEFNDRELCGGLFFSDAYLAQSASNTLWLNTGIEPQAHHHDSLQLIAELKHASPEYYKYALSYARYLRNKGSIFAQPAPIYSNISNGYGVFGMLHIHRDTIVF